jgi:dolichol kinase
VPAVRSVEGSAAVFVGCLATLVVCFGPRTAAVAVALAALLAAVEAASPHGLDNLTLPAAAAVCLRPLLAAGWL